MTPIKDIEEIRYAKMPERIASPILLPKDITGEEVL